MGVGVSRERREEVSGNIYVMAGSVVHCSHHTGGGTGGAGGTGGEGWRGWRVIIVTLLNISALPGSAALTVLLWERQGWLTSATIRKLSPTRNDYYLT